jgi:hypothetical protein
MMLSGSLEQRRWIPAFAEMTILVAIRHTANLPDAASIDLDAAGLHHLRPLGISAAMMRENSSGALCAASMPANTRESGALQSTASADTTSFMYILPVVCS